MKKTNFKLSFASWAVALSVSQAGSVGGAQHIRCFIE